MSVLREFSATERCSAAWRLLAVVLLTDDREHDLCTRLQDTAWTKGERADTMRVASTTAAGEEEEIGKRGGERSTNEAVNSKKIQKHTMTKRRSKHDQNPKGQPKEEET